ncbi:hypothetical protein B5M42_017195 [Paenibacillus athensensis]|uniref:Uncharacterized protein n=1 Tax=Paenibacillus athensensis TaxID=1967502 RepID=A0A4Y8PSJ0_9BACL|nr:hypothetical protein [Paenibacillus athensensis]MCD1260540.1 hypothetical protein [Paenibacillus athensensis]
MDYVAVLERVSQVIEEEVLININGITFTGFSTLCPYPVVEGKQYKVKLGLTILDDVIIKQLDQPHEKLIQIGEGFSYLIRGRVKDNTLESIVSFEDDFLLDFAYLNGEFIELYVDRISVEFL